MGKYFKSLFIAFIFIFLIDNVNAETIQNTCSSINQACSTKSRFTYSLYGQTDDFYTGAFGSRYSGKADYLVFDFDYDLLGNSTYMLTISASDIDFRNIKKSNTFLYASNECATPGNELDITNVSYSQSRVVITFKTVSNTTRFMLVFGSDGSSTNVTGINTFGFKSVDITTVESNDTQNIIDNANQNSQAIIDNSKENTQEIIDNQNKNNEELKDTIDKNFNNCHPSRNLFNINTTPTNRNVITSVSNNKILMVNNTNEGSTSLARSTFPISLKPNTNYTLSFDYSRDNSINSNLVGVREQESGGSWLSQTPTMNNKNGKITITFNSGDSTTGYLCFYIKNKSDETAVLTNWVFDNIMLVEGTTALPYEEYGKEICSNKLDDVNDSINGLTGAITDSSPPDTSGLTDAPGWLPPGPVDSIATLPINLLQSLTNNLESSCTPINLPIPFINDNLTLECPSTLLKRFDGFWLFWEGFGLIAGVWMMYKYFINLYKWVESHLSLDEKESLGKWGGV